MKLLLAFLLLASSIYAATPVQDDADTSATDPCSITFGAEPAQGNLMIAFLGERSGTGSGPMVHSGDGWVKIIAHDAVLGDSTHRRSFAAWAKEAGASEPTDFTLDDGTSNNKYCAAETYEFEAGEDEWTFLQKASNDNGATANERTLATGPTASVSGDKLFVVGVSVVKRIGTTNQYTSTWDTISLDTSVDSGITLHGMSLSTGYGNSDVDGTKESEFTFAGGSGLNNGLMVGLAVFRTKAGGAEPVGRHRINISE
jgi:hypothetical protein